MYFDNVGGETLDAALERMNDFGRIIACGGISQYNKAPGETYGIKNYMAVVRKQLTYQGFIVSRWADRFNEGYEQLGKWIASGDMKLKETVVNGFENLPTAFVGLFKGDNTGKMIVRVSEPRVARAAKPRL